jgi:hypothetical protein
MFVHDIPVDERFLPADDDFVLRSYQIEQVICGMFRLWENTSKLASASCQIKSGMMLMVK